MNGYLFRVSEKLIISKDQRRDLIKIIELLPREFSVKEFKDLSKLSRGMVKEVEHKGSSVFIKLALTIADCPMRNQIEKEIQRKLTLLENVENVEINVVAMDQKDRSTVMEKARKKARDTKRAVQDSILG